MATRPKRRRLKANPAHRYTVTLYPYQKGRPGMVKISPSTGHGFWEYPDGSEGGELTVQTVTDPRTGGKTLELLDFDGSYALPGRVLDALEDAGVIVGDAFYPDEGPKARNNPSLSRADRETVQRIVDWMDAEPVKPVSVHASLQAGGALVMRDGNVVMGGEVVAYIPPTRLLRELGVRVP